MNKIRAIKWRFPTARSGEKVQRSVCDRYELIESPGKPSGLFSVVLNPDLRGTYQFRVLFVERSREVALDKLEAFEAERSKALTASMEKAA